MCSQIETEVWRPFRFERDTLIGKCERDIETDFHCASEYEPVLRYEWEIGGQVRLEQDFESDSRRVLEYFPDFLRELEFVRVPQHGREWVVALLQDTDLPGSLGVEAEPK